MKEEVIAQIKQQIAENPIILYMKGSPRLPQCGFSSRAAQVLEACGVKFAFVNVLENPDIYEYLPDVADWPTFPQLFVKGELIGGCDIMVELYQQGELQKIVTLATES